MVNVPKNKRCFIYLRQSSGDGDDENDSLQTQKKLCLEAVERKGLHVVDIFTDPNISGKFYPSGLRFERIAALDDAFQEYFKGKRIQFRSAMGRLLERISEVKYIIVKDSTRLHRSVDGSHQQKEIEYIIRANNVEIIEALGITIDLNNFDQRLVNSIRTQVNDEQIAKQRKASIAKRKEIKDSGIITNAKFFSGVYHGKKIFSFDQKKSEVVKRIFKEILNYTPYSQICYIMNTEYKEFWNVEYNDADGNYISEAEYNNQLKAYNEYRLSIKDETKEVIRKPKKSGAKLFYESTLYHIASNPIYCGLMYNSNKELIKCKNAPFQLVSESDFFKVQKIMEQKKQGCSKVKVEKKRFLPLSGLIKCGNCNSKMVVGVDRGKIFYICKKSILEHNRDCGANRVLVDYDEDNIIQGLKQAITPLLIISLIEKYKNLEVCKCGISDIESIENDISKIKYKNKVAWEAYNDDIYTEEEFKALTAKNIIEIKALQEKIHNIKISIGVDVEQTAKELEQKLTMLILCADNVENGLYEELVRETIKELIVFSDKVIIRTVLGSFELQRKAKNKRLRAFPIFSISSIGAEKSYFDENAKFEIRYFYDAETYDEYDEPVSELESVLADFGKVKIIRVG